MNKNQTHLSIMQTLMMHNLSKQELSECFIKLIFSSEEEERKGMEKNKKTILKQLKNIKENLEQIDTYITLCLESKNKEFKNLGSPEKSAIRYGFWLLLGPRKMDPPLCSKIAADMVDLFSESSARSLVQGCISWAAKNQQDLALLI